MIPFDFQSDFFPLLAAILAAVSCGLLGNFLVLRRISLMGDAISHSVLPGLVIAFLVTGVRSPLAMILGAGIAGLATVVLVEVIKKLGRVEPVAAMGVIFSILFALGVLLIRQVAALGHVDLDADCVLHGQLTMLGSAEVSSFADLLHFSSLQAVPRQVTMLLVTCLVAIGFVTIFFKELRLASFDPALSTSLGFSANLLHILLMAFVAAATVASFEAVGSILVIAMLICPASTARLLTDRLRPQILWSVVVAILTAVLGYFASFTIPDLIGKREVDAAGSMAVTSGVILVVAIVISPRQGLIVRAFRRRALSRSVARDDLLATLYRASESDSPRVDLETLRGVLTSRALDSAMDTATRQGLIARDGDTVSLTETGKAEASGVIRRHRLWEHYLVDEAGVCPDHVHETAEKLEHIGVQPQNNETTDPHGKEIPPGPVV